MRKLTAGLAASAVVTAVAMMTALALVPPAFAQAGSSCGIRWGSLEKSAAGGGTPLIDVRAGRHQCYDRLVLDFRGAGASTARVDYVPAVPYQARDGSLALRGSAFLNIVLQTTTYDIGTGVSTYTPANSNELVNVDGWRTFRQVADGGSFEGYTTIGLGVRARLPFRVFSLAGPGGHSRLVIDVAHRWGSSSAAGATELPAPTSTSPVSVIHSQRVSPKPVVAAIRLGRHAAYDRVVFDIRGAMPTYAVYYTAREGLPIRGAGVLEVSLDEMDIMNSAAGPGPTTLPTIRDVEYLEAYEGIDYGIGVADRNGFRVFELQHPSRLVIDIAH